MTFQVFSILAEKAKFIDKKQMMNVSKDDYQSQKDFGALLFGLKTERKLLSVSGNQPQEFLLSNQSKTFDGLK